MIINKAEFLKSTVRPDQFPKYPYPEFAFIGRSNTGKSSLINMLLAKRNLVKTSSNPGHTQTINFFTVNDNLSFVDLPGYGYAKAPKAVREGFIPMIRGYFFSRPNLRIVFILVDIRRTPGRDELELIEMLGEIETETIIVATKCDKVNKNELKKNLSHIAAALNRNPDEICATSSETKLGRDQLIALIDQHSVRTTAGLN